MNCAPPRDEYGRTDAATGPASTSMLATTPTFTRPQIWRIEHLAWSARQYNARARSCRHPTRLAQPATADRPYGTTQRPTRLWLIACCFAVVLHRCFTQTPAAPG